MCKPLSLTALAACFLPACSSTPHFNAADANHDGRVTREESLVYIVREQVREYDANKDGRVDFAEYRAKNPSASKPRFRARDLNHDGVITAEEGIANGRRLKTYDTLFDEIDLNKDGVIDRKEAKAYAAKLGPEPKR